MSACHFCPSLWTDKSGQCRLFSIHRISLFLLLFAHERPSPFFYICPTKKIRHSIHVLLAYVLHNVCNSVVLCSVSHLTSETPREPNNRDRTCSRTEVHVPMDVKHCRTSSLACSIQYNWSELGNAVFAALTKANSSLEPVMTFSVTCVQYYWSPGLNQFVNHATDRKYS